MGDTISCHLAEVAEYRCELACLEWGARDEISPSEAMFVLTAASVEIPSKFFKKSLIQNFYSVGKAALSGNEFVALTRMIGSTVGPDDFNLILRRIERLPKYSSSRLEGISEEAAEIIAETSELPSHEQGHVLARWFRTKPGVVDKRNVTNDRRILSNLLGVRCIDLKIRTNLLDALAIWGENHGPAVLINPLGKHNETSGGRRATVAHEICHLLIDRKDALPVAEAIGGKVPFAIEQRARAFAAELLLPQELAASVLRNSAGVEDALFKLTKGYHVTRSLAVLQLYHASNTALIESEMEYLKKLVYSEAADDDASEEFDERKYETLEYFHSNEFVESVEKIFGIATNDAVTEHHAAGRSVFFQKNGEVVEVPPQNIFE